MGVGVCFVAWQRHPRSPRSDWPRLAFPVLASLLTPSPIRPPCSYYRIHPILLPMETVVLGAKCTHGRACKKKKEKKKNALLRVHTNGEREELEVIRYNGATSIYVTHVRSCIHMHVTKRYNISFNK